MAFIPVPNVAKITLQWLWAGQIVDLTLSVKKASAIGGTDLPDLAASMLVWWNAGRRAWTSTVAALTNINVTDQTTASSPSYDLPVTPAQAGMGENVSVSNNVALVTTFVTANRGRSFRGRAYTIGIPRGQAQSSTEAQTSLITALTTQYLNLNGAFNPLAFDHVVVSRYTGGAPRVTGIATPVTGYRTEAYFDSQRRRLAGRGI